MTPPIPLHYHPPKTHHAPKQLQRASAEGMALGAASMAVARTGMGLPRGRRREVTEGMYHANTGGNPAHVVRAVHTIQRISPGSGPGPKVQDRSPSKTKRSRSQSDKGRTQTSSKPAASEKEAGTGATANHIPRKPVGSPVGKGSNKGGRGSKGGSKGDGKGDSNGSKALYDLVKNAGMISYAIMARYYAHVQPVFNSRSKLRARFRTGQLTLPDGLLIIFAGGFVVTLVFVGVVIFRVLVAFGVVFQFVAGVISAVLGL